MIVGLRGKVIKKKPASIYFDVNDVIYEIFISINTQTNLDENIYLYITQIIREDSHTLYGFLSESEKEMFDRLIKLNGVGPKVALAICSTFTPSTFAEIIANKDITSLKRVPGIGPKSAQRILVELGDFTLSISNDDKSNQEAIMALESLGFKIDDIQKVLKNISATETSEIVKQALKLLTKRK